MISLVVSGIGAVVAAVGSGVLLARCFRAPRGDLIAWSVALLGLLVSLGSQALGHLTGFDAAMFRAVEIGGQVIAPLALILALSEVAARSVAVRFCARLYIPALAIVAVVILALDQLSQAAFTKAWPDPAVHYQVPPDYMLMYAIGPVTVLITVIAVGVVAARSGRPGWNAVLPAQLMGGVAALALAYPCVAQLAAAEAKIHLPVSSAFAVLCTVAAALAWMAGLRTGQLDLSALHAGSGPAAAGAGAGRDAAIASQRSASRSTASPAVAGRRARAQDDDFGDLYREDEPYRPDTGRERLDEAGYGWQDDGRGQHGPGQYDAAGDWRDAPGGQYEAAGDWRDASGGGGYANGYHEPDFATGDYATGDFAPGEFATGDLAPGSGGPGYPPGGWQGGAGEAGRRGAAPEADRFSGEPPRAPAEPERAQLFGQIAIYTLLEERVAEFDKLTERVVEQVRSREPDTLVFIVHAVPSAPMQRILYEVYRDRSAYERHNEQPYVEQFAIDRRPYVLATNVIELGLQQAKVSPFPSVTELFGEPGYDTSGFQRPDYLRDFGRTSAQPGGRDAR